MYYFNELFKLSPLLLLCSVVSILGHYMFLHPISMVCGEIELALQIGTLVFWTGVALMSLVRK